jgi:hypothetical protein
MRYFSRVAATLAIWTLVLSTISTGDASASQKTVAITSCETFRDWFEQQPGSKIFSIGSQHSDAGVHPSAFDTIPNYRWDTRSSAAAPFKQMRFYTTKFGGGGCLAGYYDPSTSTVLILLSYDTASDLVITKTTSIPGGLPKHAVPSGTQRGANLGMSVAQIQAIEGRGTMYGKNGAMVLYYNQNVKDSYGGTLYGHLAFLFLNGKVAAINAGGGH